MSSDEPASDWSEQLEMLASRGLRRTLRVIDSPQGSHVIVDGRRLTNFASNDYLGLANHSYIRDAVRTALDRWGWGAGASQLVTGHMRPHAELEARLASFKQTEAALVCPTGYQANLAAVRGLAGRGDVVFLDKLDHASIIDAAFAGGAAGSDSPRIRVFPHRDYDRLARLLDRSKTFRRRVIITDSIFSMDGDVANLSVLVELKRRYGAILCVDEAHATGVWGDHGRGIAEHMGVESEIDVVVGTLSKAFGGIGGFVAGSRAYIDWLVNSARSFIYTTAMPPVACAAAGAALDLIEREPERRRNLLAMADRLRAELRDRRGLDVADSCTQIVPVIVGPVDRAVEWSRRLEEAGLLVPAIRPPTVPAGKARLRISLSAAHTHADIDALLSAMDCS